MTDCITLEGSIDEFMIVMMGAGVGYFLIGYILSHCITNFCHRRNPEEVLIAERI